MKVSAIISGVAVALVAVGVQANEPKKAQNQDPQQNQQSQEAQSQDAQQKEQAAASAKANAKQ